VTWSACEEITDEWGRDAKACKFCDSTGQIVPSFLLRNGFGSNEKTDQTRT